MNTLSNVETRRGETNPPSISPAADAFPEATSSKTGVSVRYALDPEKSWFVFRASYGREDKAADFLVNDGTYTYIAKKYVERYVRGKRKKYLQTLIPNILFAYTTEDKAKELQPLQGRRQPQEPTTDRPVRGDGQLHKSHQHPQQAPAVCRPGAVPLQERRDGEGDRRPLQGGRGQGGTSVGTAACSHHTGADRFDFNSLHPNCILAENRAE